VVSTVDGMVCDVLVLTIFIIGTISQKRRARHLLRGCRSKMREMTEWS
jgi:hypothetical protein